MSFCRALCNPNNPHGCCHGNSCLNWTWSIPLMFITIPCWFPVMARSLCYEAAMTSINDNIEWDNFNKNKGEYEVVNS
jgi:hypothetical protein